MSLFIGSMKASSMKLEKVLGRLIVIDEKHSSLV